MTRPHTPPPDEPRAPRAPRLRRSHAELHHELHARPPLPVRVPGVVSYWIDWPLDAARAEDALARLCRALGATAPAPGVRHHMLHAGDFDLKFERHGEFVGWQVARALTAAEVDELAELAEVEQRGDDAARSGAASHAGERPHALGALPQAFAAALDGRAALAAAHVLLVEGGAAGMQAPAHWHAAAAPGMPGTHDELAPLLGGRVAGGGATVVTRLQLHDDGFVRYTVVDHGQTPSQAARTVQRLCELEAYRMLAMLGFALAQRESAALAEVEARLQATVDAMANDDASDDAGAFAALTELAAAAEHGAARTRYRFSATRAYQRLVEQRLADLREQRLDGMQPLAAFFARRFAPAMALCAATDARLTDVAERIARAVSLARVRVEMQREAGNQALFKALAHRQKLQLRLQQAVEGLSVVAISYYALGLVGYVAKALKDRLPLSSDAVVGLAALPVLAGVALFIRRLRRHYEEDGD